jgi:PAS domain-containing protein
MQSRRDTMLNLIYGAIADPGGWPEVLTRISDHVGALGGMLIYNAPPGAHSLLVLGRVSEEHSEIYRKHYAWNPWTYAMASVPFGKAVAAASLVPMGTIAKTAFCADILAPQGIADMVNVSHRAMALDGGVGGFGFSFSARGAERMDENVRKVQRLTQHLSRALEATLKLGHLADGTRQLTRVLQLMPNPALLLDGKGRITLANPAAESLLRTGDGLALDRDGGLRLAAALPAETAALPCLGAGLGGRIRNRH